MRYIVLFLAFICYGYKPIDKMKHSYSYIYGYLKLVKKDSYINCMTCDTIDEIAKDNIREFNLKIEKIGAIKASAFVYEKTLNSTNILSSEHVCASIDEFINTDWNSKDIIKDSLIKTVENYYALEPFVVVKTFEGKTKQIENVIKKSKYLDLCAIKTKGSWGIPVTFNTKCKYGEMLSNISASGGFYAPNAVPLRTAMHSGVLVVKDETTHNKAVSQNLYTLKIQPGASGSAMFDNNGHVCGNINIMYTSLDLSLGATSASMLKFLDL